MSKDRTPSSHQSSKDHSLKGHSSEDYIQLTEQYSTRNYSPLDVVVSDGQGVWVKDIEGKRYLDMLSSYSALSFGHRHPRLIAAAKRQLERITLVSRAFYNDQVALFFKELTELCGMERVLPMNSGAEAVESAIKVARKWGYEIKGVPEGKAEIICFAGNFHGRTTTIISFSDSPKARAGFGPFTPGFVVVPYGDLSALTSAINANTVGVLVEPIQGEAGVIIPPNGFVKAVREICSKNRVLMLGDEIQTGLGRCGTTFACDQEGVKPDIYILGKALAGGITPLSAIVGKRDVMDVFTPGSHGSTFGGNPFACAIGREALLVLKEEKLAERSKELGAYLLEELKNIKSPYIAEIRGHGLFIGIDIKAEHGKAKDWCKKLKEHGILSKDTRDQTIRFAPPLIIEKSEIDWALERVRKIFST